MPRRPQPHHRYLARLTQGEAAAPRPTAPARHRHSYGYVYSRLPGQAWQRGVRRWLPATALRDASRLLREAQAEGRAIAVAVLTSRHFELPEEVTDLESLPRVRGTPVTRVGDVGMASDPA